MSLVRPRHPLACSHSASISVSTFTWPSPLCLLQGFVAGFRTYHKAHCPHLRILDTSAKILFPNNITFMGSGADDLDIHVWGLNLTFWGCSEVSL